MSLPSILPLLLERRRALEQLCMSDDNLFNAVAPFMSGDFLPKTYNLLGRQSSHDGSIKADASKMQINLDVHHFAPEEISVKTSEGFIIVEGRHEEKKDEHGWVSRQFTRRFPLPAACNIEAVQSRLSSDGILTIIAPMETTAERVVPIEQTGPVRKESQDVQ